MERISFNNINSFLDYIEYCPMCKKKTIAGGIFKFNYISGKELVISNNNGFELKANIYNNSINVYPYMILNDETFSLDKKCCKYHFFYRSEIKISYATRSIIDIALSKMHFNIQDIGIHFSINSDFVKETTSIRITENGKETKELALPLIVFDLSSKKKILNRLENIMILA